MARVITLVAVLLVVAAGAWVMFLAPSVDTDDVAISESQTQILTPGTRGRGITAPQRILAARGEKSAKSAPSSTKGGGPIYLMTDGPSEIRISEVPQNVGILGSDEVRGGARIESKMTDAEILAAQEAAMNQKASSAIQNLDGSQKPKGPKPKLGESFSAIDASDCCQGTGFSAQVPPDPDLAVGPNHVIAVVNTTFEVFDKQGNSLTGPVQFSSFFDPTMGGTNGGGTPTPGCTAYADIFGDGRQFGTVFDPDAVYDPFEDRFVIGIDGNGTDFCVAATQTGDPTGAWNRYGFPTNVLGAFFDFPHMGVGNDAIYMGSNQFGGGLPFGFQGRVFAMDKFDMYAGDPLNVVTREVAPPGLEGAANVKLDGTPQPAQLPTGPGDPHYIMSEFFDGPTHSVYSWDDPFGADIWDLEGDVDLAVASGVPCPNQSCFPIAWPQKGSPEIIRGNDFRGQETKVGPDGTLWTAQTISCNPGKGTRNCVRWAQIDPTQVVPADDQTGFPLNASTQGVVQAAVFGTDWGYRSFPSIAANSCGDMMVGYSYSAAPANSGGTEYPSIFVTGRKSTDPLGQVGGERRLKKGDGAYASFQDNGGNVPVRWGDYTGMQPDPDGTTFWYIGEYAAGEEAINSAGIPTANWGTWIGSFEIPGCN